MRASTCARCPSICEGFHEGTTHTDDPHGGAKGVGLGVRHPEQAVAHVVDDLEPLAREQMGVRV
jgi:hypothetical protein